MPYLDNYFDKLEFFIDEVFKFSKLNLKYNYNFVKIHKKGKSLEFYKETISHSKISDFFNFSENYHSLNPRFSIGEVYLFTLNRILFKNTTKVFLFNINSTEDSILSFFILEVDHKTYKRYSHYELQCNYLDFLFNQLSYKVTNDLLTFSSNQSNFYLGPKDIVVMATKAFLANLKVNRINSDIDIFETINSLSKLKYESSEAIGEISITKLNNNITQNLIQIEEKISVKEVRNIRKLLEGTKGDLSLITDLKYVYGFCNRTFLRTIDDLFKIKIFSSEHWEVFYKDVRLVKIVCGLPVFDELMLEKEVFIGKLEILFPTLLNWEKEKLWSLVETLINCPHGSLLVISEGSLSEAKRLSVHSTVLKPFEMKSELITNFSKIDGAILMSPKRICSAIGVILDGLISTNGDSSRGARFNSALKYYDTLKKSYKMIIIVASEDGAIDILG